MSRTPFEADIRILFSIELSTYDQVYIERKNEKTGETWFEQARKDIPEDDFQRKTRKLKQTLVKYDVSDYGHKNIYLIGHNATFGNDVTDT